MMLDVVVNNAMNRSHNFFIRVVIYMVAIQFLQRCEIKQNKHRPYAFLLFVFVHHSLVGQY